MRVFLQQPARGADPPRYLQLTLQPDLFGGWELLHESGPLGGRGKLRRELYLQQDQAQAEFEKARDAHLHRGYAITYASGDTSP